MKIAVIEDDAADGHNLRRTLKDAGHEVILLHDWHEKDANIERLLKFSPDFILIDEDLGRSVTVTGAAIAMQLQYPKEKLIGISSGLMQAYCGQHFRGKEYLMDPDIQQGLLALITA